MKPHKNFETLMEWELTPQQPVEKISYKLPAYEYIAFIVIIALCVLGWVLTGG